MNIGFQEESLIGLQWYQEVPDWRAIVRGIVEPGWKSLFNSEKSTAIRRTAVRETNISRQLLVHNWGHFLKLIGSSQHYRIEGFKGGPLIGPHYAKRRQTQANETGDFFFFYHFSSRLSQRRPTFDAKFMCKKCRKIAVILISRKDLYVSIQYLFSGV